MTHHISSNRPDSKIHSLQPPNLESTEPTSKEQSLHLEHVISKKEMSHRSLGEHVFKWLKGCLQAITDLFLRIFCCCREKDQETDLPTVSGQRIKISTHEIKKIKKKIVLKNPQSCAEILQGIKSDIKLIPIGTGKFSMSENFVLDLKRIYFFYINREQVYSKGRDVTPEALDRCCEKMIKVLGEKAAPVAARLLNQAAIHEAFQLLVEQETKAQKLSVVPAGCDIDQWELQKKGPDTVILRLKYVFSLKKMLSDKVPQSYGYVGIEAKYTLSIKELEKLGSLSLEQLKELNTEEVAPNTEAVYTYTRTMKTEAEANKAMGLVHGLSSHQAKIV